MCDHPLVINVENAGLTNFLRKFMYFVFLSSMVAWDIDLYVSKSDPYLFYRHSQVAMFKNCHGY